MPNFGIPDVIQVAQTDDTGRLIADRSPAQERESVMQFSDAIGADEREVISERLHRWLAADTLPSVAVEVLSGGAINRNYLVHAEEKYVLRIAPPLLTRSDIGIDMSNSAIVATMAAEVGVGPAVLAVDEESGDSLIAFLPGVLNANTIREPEVLRQVGVTVRALHAVPVGNVRRVSAFDELEEWVENAVVRGVQLPAGYPELWKAVEKCRTILDGVHGRCLSHRDLNPQNCIRTDGTVRLIDWDFSGVDSPYLDMAMLATYSELSDDQLGIFLAEAIPDLRAEDVARVQLMRFVHALREWAWCLSASHTLVGTTNAETALLPTQAGGDGNFYDGYRDVNLRFAQQLHTDPRWTSWLQCAAASVPAPGFRGASSRTAASRLDEGAPAKAYVSRLDGGVLQPMSSEEIGLENVVGDPAMRVHELRSTTGHLGEVWAAVVTIEPCTFDYRFAGDETIHVLEGRATVELDGARAVELTPGTIASFSRGSSSRWHVLSRLREFAVLTGSEAPVVPARVSAPHQPAEA